MIFKDWSNQISRNDIFWLLFVVESLSCIQLYCDPMDCSPPGFSVHRISQARILEEIAISFSRGSSWPRDQTLISRAGMWILHHWATRETTMKVRRGSQSVTTPYGEHKIPAPDSSDAYERNDSAPRLLHLPIHRKLLTFLTWDIWFSLILRNTFDVPITCSLLQTSV